MNTCPKCGSWVTEADGVCADCGNRATAPVGVSAGAPVGSPLPAPAASPSGWEAGPPPVAPEKRRRPRTRVLVRVAVGLVVVLGVGVVRGAFAGGTPSALDGYMKGKGVNFTFPGDHVSVRLPEAPIATPLEGANGSSAEISHKTYELFLVSEEVKIDSGDVTTLRADLGAQLRAFAADHKISLSGTQDTMIAGRPAVSARGSYKSDETDTAVMYSGNRLYLFMVHTKHGSAEVLKELEKSVSLG